MYSSPRPSRGVAKFMSKDRGGACSVALSVPNFGLSAVQKKGMDDFRELFNQDKIGGARSSASQTGHQNAHRSSNENCGDERAVVRPSRTPNPA